MIFEADTPAGRLFDLALLVGIAVSVLAVMLESVASIKAHYATQLITVEWFFTILFTVEYVLRIISVRRPWRYATSFFGVVDLLAIVPTYLALITPEDGVRALLIIRALRLLRIFRVLKLARYVGEATDLSAALAASRAKIFVFLWTVMIVVMLVGATMYLIEGPEHGFKSIPDSIYWAVVTMTTVGYGDIAPETVPGKMLASLLMIVGYGVIAVPTGIVSSEMAAARRPDPPVSTLVCPHCTTESHHHRAKHCWQCGGAIAD